MPEKNLNQWKRKELLALPQRDWGQESEYNSLVLVNTGRKHESGYGWIAIVGVRDGVPVEIAAHCDDLEWHVAPERMCGAFPLANMKTDLLFGSGCCHAWGYNHRFRVGCSLSTTEVNVIDTKA